MKQSEGNAMKKDIEWLKAEVEKQDIVMDKGYIYTSDLIYLIDSLDEPEVLSWEWIHENKEMYLINDTSENAVPDYKLQNLLVPEQELPVIPKHVAEYLEFAKKDASLIQVMEAASVIGGWVKMKKVFDWISANDEAFARAWLDGYEVEEEPLYYALIKGHELIGNTKKYWAHNKYDSEDVFIGYDTRDDSPIVVKNTKNHWNELGVNDSNADFVKVDD